MVWKGSASTGEKLIDDNSPKGFKALVSRACVEAGFHAGDFLIAFACSILFPQRS